VYLLLVISVVKNILQLKNHKHGWYFKNFWSHRGYYF
jgi:hypothetical protein